MSGAAAIWAVGELVTRKDKYRQLAPRTLLYTGLQADDDTLIDEVLVAKFVAPNSFTGDDMVEIYCHGSQFILQTVINRLLQLGVSAAEPGEFTRRAFLNGKSDLSQAEAVADLIASNSAEAHRMAMNQLKGGISSEIKTLRDKMLELVSLMELELDFADEDVEFVDRSRIKSLIVRMLDRITGLIASFRYGNAVKTGVQVAIVGMPNTGKSTLLNTLLCESRAIVSSVAGTTRDTIEETFVADGISFRLIDTAGIRAAKDEIEELGIRRSFEKIEKAQIVILLLSVDNIPKQNAEIVDQIRLYVSDNQYLIVAMNKIDLCPAVAFTPALPSGVGYVEISAKTGLHVDVLSSMLTRHVRSMKVAVGDTIITSARHLEALQATKTALQRAANSLNDNTLSSEFISQDIREAMYFLGEITGQITNDEVLGAIFSKFCIGK